MASMLNILVVEDDLKISKHIEDLMQSEGWLCHRIDSISALNELLLSSHTEFDLILLDRLLHRSDTKAYVGEIRKKWARTPILVLSAINSPLDRTELLNLGVDDYLGKPFLNQELVARIRALCRRAKQQEETRRIVGNTVLYFDRFAIQVNGGREIILPHKEFLLLKHVTKVPGKVFNKNDMLAAIWGGESSVESNVVEAAVNSLRRRLEASGSSCRLKNLRNAGYYIEA